MNNIIIELIQEKGKNPKIPKRKRDGDAAYDIYAQEPIYLFPDRQKAIPLGFKMQLPEGYCAMIIERSGHAKNNALHSIGPLIDQNYRGEVHAILLNSGFDNIQFETGDRIAQMLVFPYYVKEPIVGKVDTTERGENGLGSSGTK